MIIDHIRDLKEFKKLYYERPMQTDLFSLEHIINNPYLFCFYGEIDNKLKGFIFITEEDKKLFLSGVSVRKNMADNKDAIIKVCEAFKQDMYSNTNLKHAVYMLKLAGFKQYDKDIFVRRYKNG